MDEVEFGRYRLLSLLGEGGMGEVWRAHDTVTNRTVAIKVLSTKLSKDEEFQRRFRREAEAAARLETPHVVPIYDYGEIDGRLFVCMRLIKGRDLATVLADGPLEPPRAVRIVGQVAEALHAAHKVGLIHRDIKPSNILLDEDDFAYLIDFGIARVADDTRMTKTGNTIGTFAYMAPERLDGEGEEDARVDIYSLACVLYECLTGEPPFSATTMPRLIMAHVSSPPPRPSIARPDVPDALDPVIATGMAKDPNERYATTVELADAAHDAITTPIPWSAQGLRTTPAAFATIPPATEPDTHQQAADLDLATTQQGPPDDGAGSPHRLLETQAAPETVPATPKPWWSRQRRQVKVALIAGIVVILAASASITDYVLRQPTNNSQPVASSQPTTTSRPPTTTPPVPPVAEAALDGLLLSPDQINTAMGATEMVVTETPTTMGDITHPVANQACLPLNGPLLAPVYAGSGWSAFREQILQGHLPWTHRVDYGVVLFSSAHDASAFFTASAQQWPACTPALRRGLGQVSNTNGTLSATETTDYTDGSFAMTCQRALTVANNVVIDVLACSTKVSDSRSDSGVNIAQQIAAKVPT